MVLEGALGVFGVGCAGGALAEALHWWNLREKLELPHYVKSLFYWVMTLVMIATGGFVAWLYFGDHAEALVAVHVGLSAPLILQKLIKSVPKTSGAKSVITTPAPSLRGFFSW